jgi:hypothetical protein
MAKTFFAIIIFYGLLGTAFGAAIPAPQKPARPDWVELKPAQQEALAPLKEHWAELDTTRRQKWVKVANSYPKLKPDEQLRLQERMRDWVRLSSEERRTAREKYLAIKKLPPAKREEVKLQWEQYQQSLAKSESSASETTTGAGPAQ